MQRSSSRALHGLDALKCCRHQIRFQSTDAPASKLSFAEFTTGVDAAPDAKPAKIHRTPRISALGDIVIPSNFRTSADGPKIIPHRAPSKDYRPSLKWISDDQTGASFSVRAARRRAQQVYAQRLPDEESSSVSPAPSTDLPAAGQLLTRASQLNKSFKELGQGNTRNGKQQERKTERKPQRGNSQGQQRPSASAQENGRRPEQQKKAPVAQVQSRPDRERTPRQRPSPPPPPPKTPRGLLVDLQTTDLTQLFSTPVASPAQSSVVPAVSGAKSSLNSMAALRIQLSKERVGGDYSRYLSPRLVGTMGVRALSPVHHAALVLARRREAGLRTRRRGLEVVQKMVGMTDEISA